MKRSARSVCTYIAHRLVDDIPDDVRRLPFHPLGSVGIGIQCESRAVMAQRVGEGLHVNSILEGQCSERMPLWHNKDKSENPCIAAGWRFVIILFPLKIPPKMGVRGGGEKARLHIKDKFWTI